MLASNYLTVNEMPETLKHNRDASSATDALDADLPARLRAAIGSLSRQLRHTTATSSGLTPSEISALLTIARRGPLRLNELAEIEAMNPTMLSRITSHLTELGFISRSCDPSDRRAAVVDATSAGRRMRKRIQRERTEVLEDHLRVLSTRERELLGTALPLLERLADSVKDSRR